MFRSSVLGLTMLPGQRLTSEIREHLPGSALLAPGPFLDGEQHVVVKAQVVRMHLMLGHADIDGARAAPARHGFRVNPPGLPRRRRIIDPWTPGSPSAERQPLPTDT